jgi:hypothetical protein
MQSQTSEPMQSVAVVRPVEDSVGYLDTEIRDFLSCPWCGESLPPSKTRPRMYCSEAHEKAFKRAGRVNKEQNEARKLAATNASWSRLVFIQSTGTFHDASAEKKQPTTVADHSAFESVTARNAFHPAGVDTYRIPKYGRGLEPSKAEGSLATTPRKVTHQVDVNDRPVAPEPTKVLPEFWPSTPETPLFIGPLLKNGRKRGRA